MSERVRILLRHGDEGAFTLTARAAPYELAATLARFRSADIVLGEDAVQGNADEVVVYDLAAGSSLGRGVPSSAAARTCRSASSTSRTSAAPFRTARPRAWCSG